MQDAHGASITERSNTITDRNNKLEQLEYINGLEVRVP